MNKQLRRMRTGFVANGVRKVIKSALALGMLAGCFSSGFASQSPDQLHPLNAQQFGQQHYTNSIYTPQLQVPPPPPPPPPQQPYYNNVARQQQQPTFVPQFGQYTQQQAPLPQPYYNNNGARQQQQPTFVPQFGQYTQQQATLPQPYYNNNGARQQQYDPNAVNQQPQPTFVPQFGQYTQLQVPPPPPPPPPPYYNNNGALQQQQQYDSSSEEEEYDLSSEEEEADLLTEQDKKDLNLLKESCHKLLSGVVIDGYNGAQNVHFQDINALCCYEKLSNIVKNLHPHLYGFMHSDCSHALKELYKYVVDTRDKGYKEDMKKTTFAMLVNSLTNANYKLNDGTTVIGNTWKRKTALNEIKTILQSNESVTLGNFLEYKERYEEYEDSASLEKCRTYQNYLNRQHEAGDKEPPKPDEKELKKYKKYLEYQKCMTYNQSESMANTSLKEEYKDLASVLNFTINYLVYGVGLKNIDRNVFLINFTENLTEAGTCLNGFIDRFCKTIGLETINSQSKSKDDFKPISDAIQNCSDNRGLIKKESHKNYDGCQEYIFKVTEKGSEDAVENRIKACQYLEQIIKCLKDYYPSVASLPNSGVLSRVISFALIGDPNIDADSFKSLECNEAIKKLDSVKSSLKNEPLTEDELTGDELTEEEIISEVKKNLKDAIIKDVELQNPFKGIFKEMLDSLGGDDLKLDADARQALFMDFPVFSDICAWIVGEIVSDEEIKIAAQPTINSQLIKDALNALKTKIATWNGGIKGYMEDRAEEAFYHYNTNVLDKFMYLPDIIDNIVANSETHTQIASLLKSLMPQRPDTVNMAQPSQDEVCEKLYEKYDEDSGFNENEKAAFLIKKDEFTQIFKWLPNVISGKVNDIVTLAQIKGMLNDIITETATLKEDSSIKNYISIYGGDSFTANTSSDHIIGVINEIQNDQSTLEWMLNYINSKQEPKSKVENGKKHHHDTTQEESRSTHKSKKGKKHLKDQKNDNNQHRKQQAQQVLNQNIIKQQNIAEPGSIGYVPQSVKIDNKNQNNNTKPRSDDLQPNQPPTLPIFVNDPLTPADIYKRTPSYLANKQNHDQSAAQANNTNRNTDPGNNQVRNEVDPGYTKNIIGIAQSVTSQVLHVTAQLVKTSFGFIKNWLGW